MIEIKSIENLIQEKSKVLAEIESLKAEQIFVDKIESFTLAANEYIEQLEAENAELRAKLSNLEKRLGLFLEGDISIKYSGIDNKWVVHYE